MKHKFVLFVIIAVVILGLNFGCTPTFRQEDESYPANTVHLTSTEITIEPTVIPSRTPTRIPIHLPTATISESTPFPGDDDFYKELLDQGYSLLDSSSTIGSGGYTYSGYLFLDSTFPIVTKPGNDENIIYALPSRNVSFDELENVEGCKIAFYRSDGQNNELLYSFAAPKYPEGSYYNHYPVSCMPASWNTTLDGEVYELLNFNGDWSDINQNGLPEFVVHYQYCPNACVSAAVSAHFYEIQSMSKVVDITADLPGIMEPFGMVHSKSPFSFYVYDPTLWYSKWVIIDTWWIYAWNGEEFVDVTPNYADEYIARGEKIIASVQERYNDSFYEWELLTILFLYEKAGLRDEAIDIFLEISDPSNWPDANSEKVCWLQVARATAIDDYKNERSFQFPTIQVEVAPASLHHQFANNFDPEFDVVDYDISACDEFMP